MLLLYRDTHVRVTTNLKFSRLTFNRFSTSTGIGFLVDEGFRAILISNQHFIREVPSPHLTSSSIGLHPSLWISILLNLVFINTRS